MFMKTNRLYDRMSVKPGTLAPSISGKYKDINSMDKDKFYYNKQTEVDLL